MLSSCELPGVDVDAAVSDVDDIFEMKCFKAGREVMMRWIRGANLKKKGNEIYLYKCLFLRFSTVRW